VPNSYFAASNLIDEQHENDNKLNYAPMAIKKAAPFFTHSEIHLDTDAHNVQLKKRGKNGQLAKFDVVDLSFHGERTREILGSFFWVAPDQPVYGTDVADWKMEGTSLVLFNSCRSFPARFSGGDGFLGFAFAMRLAGAQSIVATRWRIDDRAAALLTVRFLENITKRQMSQAQGMREAKSWLSRVTAEEAAELIPSVAEPVNRGVRPKSGKSISPATFAHPHYWCGHFLYGDQRQ
jgi:CHAT domain-containing protein